MAAVRQEVITLALPPGLRQRLVTAGFRTVADLEGVSPVELSRELQITHEEALLVIKISGPVQNQHGGLLGAKSAQELHVKEASARKIVTFCADLDEILGGGVTPGQITEFCGVPAVGKTQLGIQLAVDVQIPPVFKGLGGSAVYIDTEGSFTEERVAEIAQACVVHLHKIAANSNSAGQLDAANALDVDKLLENIFVFRVRDATEQVAVTQALPDFIDQHPEVRLVVIDSITFHFRQDFSDMAQRSRLLGRMAQQLMQLAVSRDIAVALMNQVTTKVGENEKSRLVPALGDSWAHAATNRVIMYWKEKARTAFLYKCPSQPARSAEFIVTADGVRGKPPPKRPRQGE